MPKIGMYLYPAIDFDEALKYTKILVEKFAGDAKRGLFSESIGKKGGWFNDIVASLGEYGLVEVGFGRIKATPIAQKALFPINDDEATITKNDIVRSIKLFDEISSNYPQGVNFEQFQIFLRDRGGADQQTVIKESLKPYKIYSAISKYLKPAGPSKLPTGGVETAGVKQDMDVGTTCPQGVLATVTTSEGERFLIKEQSVLDALLDAIYEARKKLKQS